jgi:hypothetical protein
MLCRVVRYAFTIGDNRMNLEFQFLLHNDPEQYTWDILETLEATLADICKEFDISMSDIETYRIVETIE